MLEYKIVKKAQFTVMGKRRRFNNNNSYSKVPEFWQEHMSSGDKTVCGMFGVCAEISDREFDYYIADNYLPWNEVPDGYETKVIPAGTWAVFPCRGKLPEALQSVNTKIWNDWLPSNKKYKIAGKYNIEMYGESETYSEIWIPVEKI